MRLLRAALIAATLSLSFTSLAHAQYELSWDQCAGSPQAIENKRFDCSSGDSHPLRLVIAFTPQRSIKEFVGFTANLDIATTGNVMPDWWRLGVGECREGGLTFPASAGSIREAAGGCENPWTGAATGGGYLWTTGMSGAGTAKLQLAFARDGWKPVPVNSGTRYIAGVIEFDASAGSSCSGCDAEMCISLVDIELAQVVVANDNSTEAIKYTRSTGRTVVTFNVRNAGSNPCGSKVRNRTWGQVKSTYR